MKKPLVTILSPVYNGESYIERFIKNILELDYDNLQFILINDGSTDKTEKIIKKYKKKLENKMEFVYLKQENKGAAGAVNNGLQYVKGEYITWPDSDDLLTKDSISKKVEFLEKNKSYGFLISNARVYDENDLNKVLYTFKLKNSYLDDIFERLLYDKNIYYCCGVYMARVSALRKSIPTFKIYETKYGQNWQLLLSLAFYYKCGYLNEYTYHYIIRENSHSHNQKSYEDFIKKYNGYEDILINVIDELKIKDKDKLKESILIKYAHIRLDYAVKYKNYEDFNKEYNKLKKLNDLTLTEKIYNIFSNKKLIQDCINHSKNIINFPKRVINKIIKVIIKNDKI